MGLETATSIAALNSAWPLGTDLKSQGDDHIRLIKRVLKSDVVPKAGGTFDGTIEIGEGVGAGPTEAGAALGAAFLDLKAPSSAPLGSRIMSATYGGDVAFRLTNGGSVELTPAQPSVQALVISTSGLHVADLMKATRGGTSVFKLGATGLVESGQPDAASNAGRGALLSQAGVVTAQRDTGQAATSIIFSGFYGNTLNFLVRANGTLQTTPGSITTISDPVMKDGMEPATPKLADLLRLSVINYRLKTDPMQRKLLGFDADDMAEVFPALVEEVEDGVKTVNVFPLIPALVVAVQELSARLDALEAPAAA